MKVGIITYHSAYNYGSVLQAYATQVLVQTLGYDVEIINYRMNEQKQVYKLYRNKYGIKTLIKDLLQFPIHRKRKKRQEKFEAFIEEKLMVTAPCSTPHEVEMIWEKFDTIISGSDQIWNKHSLELENNSWEYMKPYLLAGYSGKKVSYASSIANMNDEELDIIAPYLCHFQNISMREMASVQRMEKLLDRRIDTVLDPTFLLNKAEWLEHLDIRNSSEEKYILFYSLSGIKTLKKNMRSLIDLARMNACTIKVISPFSYVYINNSNICMCPELGPIEFMSAIYNAEYVVTDSYHGTILSINLEKEFYSICGEHGSEFRKVDILNKIGLTNRIVASIEEILDIKTEKIEYSKVNKKIVELRNDSIGYMNRILES